MVLYTGVLFNEMVTLISWGEENRSHGSVATC